MSAMAASSAFVIQIVLGSLPTPPRPSEIYAHWHAVRSKGGGPALLQDARRDPAAGAHRDAAVAGLRPDRAATLRRAHVRVGSRAALRACSMNGASLPRKARAFLALRSISSSPPPREPHYLICPAAIQIVFQRDDDLLRHYLPPVASRCCRHIRPLRTC